jgi:hypothetical protein
MDGIARSDVIHFFCLCIAKMQANRHSLSTCIVINRSLRLLVFFYHFQGGGGGWRTDAQGVYAVG